MAAQGRDANRKLQRAIRAGKARERLPALLAALGARAAAWAEAEGRPFLWDGQDFEVRACFSRPVASGSVTHTCAQVVLSGMRRQAHLGSHACMRR